MKKEDYIILRIAESVPSDEATSKGILGPALVPTDVEAQTLSTEVAELDSQECQEIRRDSRTFGIAPAIPTQLIRPLMSSASEPEFDSFGGATWGVTVTGAVESPYSGSGVVVAVLDTGIDPFHEAFSGIELIQQDFTGEGTVDANGHGTHVAGTIFGQPGGEVRYGVAPGIRRALIGKVLGSNGTGSTDQIFRAIQWAIDQGAMILNMSLGMDYPGYVERLVESGWPVPLAVSRALQAYRDNVRLFDAVIAMYKKRSYLSSNSALFVSAAGNESRRELGEDYVIDVSPPAAAEGVISVGALATSGPPHTALTVAAFSNINPVLSAPGVGVYSAKAGGGYAAMNGTSMAAPHVTGVAALWMEWQIKKYGRVDYSMISNRLLGRASAQRFAAPDDLTNVGAGLVQAPTA